MGTPARRSRKPAQIQRVRDLTWRSKRRGREGEKGVGVRRRYRRPEGSLEHHGGNVHQGLLDRAVAADAAPAGRGVGDAVEHQRGPGVAGDVVVAGERHGSRGPPRL